MASKFETVKKELMKEAKVAVEVYHTNPLNHSAINYACEELPFFKEGWKRQIALANEFDLKNQRKR